MGYTGTLIPYSLSEVAIVLSSLTQKHEKGRVSTAKTAGAASYKTGSDNTNRVRSSENLENTHVRDIGEGLNLPFGLAL